MTFNEFIDFCKPYMGNDVSIQVVGKTEIWICHNNHGIIRFAEFENISGIIVPHDLKIVDNMLLSVDEKGVTTSSWRQDQEIDGNDYDTLRKKLIEINAKAKEIRIRKKINELKKDFA